MSRVQDVSDILLAQPYSPQLFRQGVLPGPDLLQKVLKDEITTEVAKGFWKEDEDREKARNVKKVDADKWSLAMEIPCRQRTDNNGGVEVM